MSLEVSDGVSTANLIFNQETQAEIELAKIQITENSVIVFRGRISRQPNENGNTVLTINECPRFVLTGGTKVLGRIGQPVPFQKACEQNKYADYE